MTLNLFLSEAEQIQQIDEAESVKTPSAFSIPEPAAQAEPVRRALTQAEIDTAIQEWNGNIESKHAVVRYMKVHAREKDTAAWLRLFLCKRKSRGCLHILCFIYSLNLFRVGEEQV